MQIRRIKGCERLLVTTAVAGALVAAGPSRAAADTLQAFTAVLNGGQEFPAVATPSQGVAFLTLNQQQRLLCYAISFSPLVGTETVAHFHGPAAPGQNAGILFDITPTPSPVGSPKTGCVGPLQRPQIRDLRRGLLYINVHSTTFPAGEIRGQVLPVAGLRYRKVPPVAFSPSGAFLDPATL